MPDFAAPVERLIEELKHLPGIGLKTAQRLAFHLLRAAPEDALALADAIRDAREKIRAAVNEASRRVDEELASQMKNLAGGIPGIAGIKIPGLF